MNKLILEFAGIDSWNRPVFKREGKNAFYGDTDNLFAGENSRKERILEFYKNNPEKLQSITYFGDEFDCEPWGYHIPADSEIILK